MVLLRAKNKPTLSPLEIKIRKGQKQTSKHKLHEWQNANHIYIYLSYGICVFLLLIINVSNLMLYNMQMNVGEAREVCQHGWMKEALDILVDRLTSPQHDHKEEE